MLDENTQRIINLILSKQLPLSIRDYKCVKAFCCRIETDKLTRTGYLWNLGKIFYTLRRDWLNFEIPLKERATKNITISSRHWRMDLERICIDIIKNTKIHNACGLVVWRAGLAFMNAFNSFNIDTYHIRVSRNKDLSIYHHTELPLENVIGGLRKRNRLIIADPMLATGSSIAFIIDKLKLEAPDLFEKHFYGNIEVASVVSCPEGIFHLMNKYPGITINTGCIDGNLDATAYIVNCGLGDAGDKYFYENHPSNFDHLVFKDSEFEYLKKVFEEIK